MKHMRLLSGLTALTVTVTMLTGTGLSAFADASKPGADINPETGMPYAFDLRSLGLVSPVKDQGSYGTCWAHAIVNGLETGQMAKDPEIDLSEWHLTHYKFQYESLDLDEYLALGSFYQYPVQRLLNRIGPVKEADCPYGGDVPDLTKTPQQLQKEACLGVTDCHSFTPSYDPHSENDTSAAVAFVKQGLYTGHAVGFSLSKALFDMDCYDKEHFSFYCTEQRAEEIIAGLGDDANIPGHAMSIVGWDDSFPASSFYYTPPTDGAFLVKNSWGPGFGDGGYFWISYAEDMIHDLYYLDTEPASLHDSFFSYDGGCCGILNYKRDYSDPSLYYANIFYPDADTCLTDLMLCTNDPEDTLEVTVYTDLHDIKDPTSGTASETMTYRLPHAGYQTVPISRPVSVKSGEPFSVTVKVSDPNGVSVPCEITPKNFTPDGRYQYATGSDRIYGSIIFSSSDSFSETEIDFDLSEHKSFISTDGTAWKDVLDTNVGAHANNLKQKLGNVCVRALGVDAGRVRFSEAYDTLAVGEQISLSSAEGADIYYAVNGSDYQRYTEPVTFTGDMTISAYADLGEKTVYTRHFTQQHAVLSSLLERFGYYSVYADLSLDVLHAETSSFDSNFALQPISTGSITINGNPVISGEVYQVTPADIKSGITICVEQDGMLPTTYKMRVHDRADDPILNGIYYLDELNAVWDLRDGIGTQKNLTDGKTESFTYEKEASGRWVFRFEDRTEHYAAQLYYSILTLKDESGREIYASLCSRLPSDMYQAFATNEIAEPARKAYNEQFGKTATSVLVTELEYNAELQLDFYNGTKKIDTLYANHFGSMYTDELVSYYYSKPRYKNCDFDGNGYANMADAVLLLRFISEDRPEIELPPEALRTADINSDGILDLTDAQLLMDALHR